MGGDGDKGVQGEIEDEHGDEGQGEGYGLEGGAVQGNVLGAEPDNSFY